MTRLLCLFGLPLVALPAAAKKGHGGKGPHTSLEHMWGTCSEDGPHTDDGRGCQLADDLTCSHRASDGPEDADVEVTVGNLPASTSGEQVHLQWWATYESSHEYDVLVSFEGASIYRGFSHAYPKYSDPEFNGGNILVNASGFATIRIRKPAIFFLPPSHIAYPHVHLRVCTGSDTIRHPDTMMFSVGEVWMRTKSQDAPIQIASVGPYLDSKNTSVAYNIPDPIAWVHAVYSVTSLTTTITTNTREDETTITTITTTSKAGGAAVPVDPQTLAQELAEAKEDLDTDALYNSPIYSCFENGQFYSHYEEDCVDECADGFAAVKGQCVAHETQQEEASFDAEWELEVRCSELCGADAKNETLHRIRLEVAALLKVPFQETEVAMTWLGEKTSRRLAVVVDETHMLALRVSVSTKRLAAAEGVSQLETLIQDAAAASGLLQLHVTSMALAPSPLGGGQPGSSTDTMGSGTDPYENSYEFLQPFLEDSPEDEGTEAGWLSFGKQLALMLAGCFLLGALCGYAVWRRRRRRMETVEGKMVDDPWEVAVPPAPAMVPPTEIGQPEENNTGAGVL